MTKRIVALQIFLLLGFGAVLFLPKHIQITPASISLSLPASVGDWEGVDQAITQGEIESLGPDTQFARKLYSLGTDQIFVSIVLSGPDMSTSIHRPERCLPGQGWTIVNSRTTAVPTVGKPLQVTRLENVRDVPAGGGKSQRIRSLDYYWFVGSSEVTPSHLTRAWIDIRERVLLGRDQQWAYITVMTPITKDFRVFGRTEEETDKLLGKFIVDLVPQIEPNKLAAR